MGGHSDLLGGLLVVKSEDEFQQVGPPPDLRVRRLGSNQSLACSSGGTVPIVVTF